MLDDCNDDEKENLGVLNYTLCLRILQFNPNKQIMMLKIRCHAIAGAEACLVD